MGCAKAFKKFFIQGNMRDGIYYMDSDGNFLEGF